MGVAQKADWLEAISLKRREATPGTWFAMRPTPSEPDEPLGEPIGIGSAHSYWATYPPTPHEVELGTEPEPEECCDMHVVGLLAWGEWGDELPRCEQNIDYLCDLHNQFPVLAAELRKLRAAAVRNTVVASVLDERRRYLLAECKACYGTPRFQQLEAQLLELNTIEEAIAQQLTVKGEPQP